MKKTRNALLSDFDETDLKKIITDKVTIMIAANLDRWMPETSSDQCERNVNSARTTAACIAQRVLVSINSDERQPRLRDLTGLLQRASVDAEFILVVGNTEKTICVGKNESFPAAVSGRANEIIFDLVSEPS